MAKAKEYKKVDFYKTPKGKKAVKALGGIRKELKSAMREYKIPKAKVAKKVVKSTAKKVAGKVASRAIPGVGAVMIAHDVIKGISKATCSKRGGKWTSGKCVGAKKVKTTTHKQVRDPISKR